MGRLYLPREEVCGQVKVSGWPFQGHIGSGLHSRNSDVYVGFVTLAGLNGSNPVRFDFSRRRAHGSGTFSILDPGTRSQPFLPYLPMKVLNQKSVPETSNLNRCWPFLEILSDLDETQLIWPEWTSVRNRSGCVSAATSPDAILSWWLSFQSQLRKAFGEVKLEILVVRDLQAEGGILAIIPCYTISRNKFRGIPAQLVSIGRWPNRSVETMVEEPSAVVLPDHRSRVAEIIGDFLDRQFATGELDLAHIEWPMEDADAIKLECDLRRNFSKKHRIVSKFSRPVSLIELADSWCKHRNLMTRAMRGNLTYYPNLLKRNNVAWRLRVRSEPHEMEEAVSRLVALHHKRSSDKHLKPHTNHIPGDAQRNFLTQFFRRLAYASEGFIAELIVGENVVATQAYVRVGRTLTVYYSGFDPVWKRYSPLLLLQSLVFREAIAEGISRLNFMTGTDQWQKRWGPSQETYIAATFIFNARPSSMLLAGSFIAIWKSKSRWLEAMRDFNLARYELRKQKTALKQRG